MIKVAKPTVGDEEVEAVAEVLYSGNYVSGKKVVEFESAWSKYIGVEHCVAVNSGTAALHLALQSFGVAEGDEVIVPALTFFSTVSAVLMCGATPVFADIDRETYCMNTRSATQSISDKTVALIPVSLYGHPAEMLGYERIAEKHGLIVIEDVAQAHGAEFRNKKCGSFKDCGCWSFYATKNMTTGEGGAITTDNPDLAEVARVLRSHGMTDRNTHSMLGYNYRMNEMAAAIGLVQLQYLDKYNEVREWNSLYLRENLADVEWLKVPPVKPYVKHAWFWAAFQVDEDRLGMTTLELRAKLMEKGVETRHRYVEPLYKQPVLEQYKHLHDYSKDYCQNAEEICGRVIGLPNHPYLSLEDLEKVVEVVKSI